MEALMAPGVQTKSRILVDPLIEVFTFQIRFCFLKFVAIVVAVRAIEKAELQTIWAGKFKSKLFTSSWLPLSSWRQSLIQI